MSIFSRFFGKKEVDSEIKPVEDVVELMANPNITDALAFVVLFPEQLNIDPVLLKTKLREYDPSMQSAMVDIEPELNASGTTFGLVGWGKHVVRLVGFDAPIPHDTLDVCVGPAHYSDEYKDQAYQHQSNLILYYAGYETDPIQQYVALSAVVGALADMGAIIVINESAHSSLPTVVFSHKDASGSMFEMIESLPLLMLFCGFVKYQVDGVQGVWLRTYGAYHLSMPDFAVLAAGHEESEYYFEMFSNLYAYLQSSGATFSDKDTMQVGEDAYMRLRHALPEEYFLQSKGQLFVAEIIHSEQINR